MTDTGFFRPTLLQIRQRILNDLKSGMDGVDAFLRRSFLYVIGVSLAGLIHGFYGYLDWIARQGIPDTAEGENLRRWATLFRVFEKEATHATGFATLTGTMNGSLIAPGTRLQRGDGMEFMTTTPGMIASGVATVTVQAILAGKQGNTDAGTTLIFTSPISGVYAVAIAGELSGGTDAETDTELRVRMKDEIRTPAHGGAKFDYVKWALQVPGVTRAWAYPQELAPNGVTVRFMMDDAQLNGIPSLSDVQRVRDYIEERRPTGADVMVVAPVALTQNFSILLKDKAGHPVLDLSIREAVQAELADLIRREAEPGGTLFWSRLNEAISIAEGEFDHVLSSPSSNVNCSTGQIATMGIVTWL